MQTHLEPSSPHIERNHGWRVWWQLIRPHTLTAAFAPVLLGTALAAGITDISQGMFFAMLAASLLIQAATNMFNEYYDYKKGLDTKESVGIGGAIVRDGLQPSTVLSLAFLLYGIALFIGIYICANSSWWLAAIGLVSMAAGYFYTGGPLPIAYTPFGEIVAGFFMGLLIILISFYIQVGTVTVESVLVAFPSFMLVGAILLANNIRDLEGDKDFGRKTLAILIGRNGAINLLMGMFIVSYAWIAILIFIGTITPWVSLIALSLPKAIGAVKGFRTNSSPLQMMPAMKATAQTNTFFGLLLSVGLFIQYFL
ncbi:1,4-dihydroxy-2-naphthoate polyprenyltransferase [Bacillus massilinigeriensis]|uniref:1,4-dihydroxy-2-naphthoate polyprenyltransferase n=1 Tax=Bacillus mediterraneensis TaxID=1805474 RepID=UPI0008F928D7|nr:1,4-dihydroxy-2-naphthoate polyprenyltransferase [Bacillus mediterraneensis]